MKILRIRTLSLATWTLAGALAAQAPEHDLRITAKKGATACFVQQTKQEQAIDMEGQSMDMGNSIEYAVRITVADVDDKGQLTVRADIVRVRGTMTVPMMGDVEFDSASETPPEDDGMGMAAMGEAMSSLAGKSFLATVGSYGRVAKIEGLDTILAEARKKGGRMAGQMLAGSLNERAFETIVENVFGALPEKPIAVGTPWTRTTSGKASRAAVDNKMELTLASFDAESFEITAKGTVEKSGGDAQAKDGEAESEEEKMARAMMDGMKIKNGKIEGRQKISRTDGFLLEGTSQVSMDLEMQSPMGGEVAIAMKTTITAKRATEESLLPKKAEPAKK